MAADNDNMEVEEEAVEPGSNGKAWDRVIDVDGPQNPIQSIQAGRSQKTTKCAFCRRDHKKVKKSPSTPFVVTDNCIHFSVFERATTRNVNDV